MSDNYNYNFKFFVGEVEYQLIKFSGEEKISSDFNFIIDIVDDKSVGAVSEGILDLSCRLEFYDNRVSKLPQRIINGIVASYEATGFGYGNNKYAITYRITMRSEIYRLSLNLNYRIFQDVYAEDIIKSIMGDHENIISYYPVYKITEEHDRRELTTQYGESDKDFIDRISSEDGIFYWITDTEIVFSDLSFAKYVGESYISNPDKRFLKYVGEYEVGSHFGFADTPRITSFNPKESIAPSVIIVDSYDEFGTRENLSRDVASDMQRRHIADKYVMHVRDGIYNTRIAAWRKGKVITSALDVQSCYVNCTSDIMKVQVGSFIKIKDYGSNGFATNTYYITSVTHQAEVSAKNGGITKYSNSFNINHKDMVYRPQIIPKPKVYGLEVGLVIGQSDEPDTERNTVYCDEYGRVLVRFDWALSQEYIDRNYSRKERKFRHSSWLRSSQMFTGNNWGAVAIPRVGEEVLISFLQGDPDKPIITGRVYNDFSNLPYNLPEHNSKTVIRTATMGSTVTKDAKGKGFNELSFDDKDQAQKIFIRAERDFVTETLNDSSEIVQNNKDVNITNNLTSYIGMNYANNINGSSDVTVAGASSKTVKGVDTLNVIGAHMQNIGGGSLLNVAGAYSITVAGALTEQIVGFKSSLLKGNSKTVIEGNYDFSVAKNYKLAASENYTIDVSKDLKESVVGNRFASVIGDANFSYEKTLKTVVNLDSFEKVTNKKYIEAKDLILNGTESAIVVSEKLIITSGENSIEITPDGINILSKSDITIVASKLNIKGNVEIGGSSSTKENKIEEDVFAGFTKFQLKDKETGAFIPFSKYSIKSGNAVVDTGISSKDGYTSIFKIEKGKEYKCIVESYSIGKKKC